MDSAPCACLTNCGISITSKPFFLASKRQFGACVDGCPKALPPGWPQTTDSIAGEIHGYRCPQTDDFGRVSADPGDNRAAADIVSVFRHPRPRCSFPSGSQRRRRRPAFPGKDGGREKFLRAAGTREFAKPESAKSKAQLLRSKTLTACPILPTLRRWAHGLDRSQPPLSFLRQTCGLFPGAVLGKAPLKCLERVSTL